MTLPTVIPLLLDALVGILCGAKTITQSNSTIRLDPAVQRAFGRTGCAEQSTITRTLRACTAEHVMQLERVSWYYLRRYGTTPHHRLPERVYLPRICGRALRSPGRHTRPIDLVCPGGVPPPLPVAEAWDGQRGSGVAAPGAPAYRHDYALAAGTDPLRSPARPTRLNPRLM